MSRRAQVLTQLTLKTDSARRVNGSGTELRPQQLEKFRRQMQWTFLALQQNGTVDTRAARYIVHSYFVRQLGMAVKGLEPEDRGGSRGRSLRNVKNDDAGDAPEAEEEFAPGDLAR